MLVLTRKRDESIIIGDDVEITIVDIKGEKVKIGVSAPKTLSIHRKEIYEAIQEENKAAVNTQAQNLSALIHVIQKRKPISSA
ncbi:MAG: carbon storage regulator CsrA [Candidatus Hinthialibacter sp.]